MDLFSLSGFEISRSFINKFVLILFPLVVGAALSTTAQNRIVQPRVVDTINRNQPTLNIQQRDTTNLEFLNTGNFQTLQLLPQGRTILNLDRNIARVDARTFTQIDPAILAGIDKQSIFSFPEVYVENKRQPNPPASGSSSGGSTLNPETDSGSIIYQPVITSLKPLVYDHSAETFISTLNFLLLSQSQLTGNISNPMPIELHSDYLDNIQPSQLRIDHLNLPSTSINIAASDARDSVQIRFVTEANTSGYETYLMVEPALNLFTERQRLQGLGIQEIPIQVNWKGSSSDESKTVNISTSSGSVTPNSVNLSYNKPAIVFLRSEGLGRATLTASTSDAQSNTLTLNFIFPWLFLIFAIGGGFLGGTAKYFTLKDKPKSFLSATAGSILIGLLGALAYFVLGINLLEIEFSSTFNEFAVFGISALIAFFGIRKIKSSAD